MQGYVGPLAPHLFGGIPDAQLPVQQGGAALVVAGIVVVACAILWLANVLRTRSVTVSQAGLVRSP